LSPLPGGKSLGPNFEALQRIADCGTGTGCVDDIIELSRFRQVGVLLDGGAQVPSGAGEIAIGQGL
jgi:hypothetical protein